MRNAMLFTAISMLVVVSMAIAEQSANLFKAGSASHLTLVVPDDADPLEEYAAEELATHLEKVTGVKPQIANAKGVSTTVLAEDVNLVILGRVKNNRLLEHLVQTRFLQPNTKKQGFSIRIDSNPQAPESGRWLAALCGADPHGVLYAVRDFCHYHFYKDESAVVLHKLRAVQSPRIKLRGLSESGCNLFSAKNTHPKFKYDQVRWNRFNTDVVFDKQHYIDWLSEWKINYVSLLWCNARAYDEARREFVGYAHSRGLQVIGFYVPYRPSHEDPPTAISSVPPEEIGHGDCPRDPKVRRWYFDRLLELVMSEPRIDMIQLESPYHDGVYCQCEVCRGRENPYPEAQMLAEMVEVVRNVRPKMPIIRVVNRPVPNAEAARQLAEQLRPLEGSNDWYGNTNPNRGHRIHWHNLGPKFTTYTRLYRSALKGDDIVRDVNFLFNDFRMSAERDIVAHQFCYRFYAGRIGSYPVAQDRQMRSKYPDRSGPFSLALTAEAAFDPFVSSRERARKIERIYALTIPDYPRGRTLTDAELQSTGLPAGERDQFAAPVIEDPAAAPSPSKLFRSQYSIRQPGFLIAQVCADLDNDGHREIFYSSRGTKLSHLLRATDGTALWNAKFSGEHQSIMAYDLDGDDDFEILYSVSSPGRLYVLDHTGKVLRQWDSGDHKLGNSAVIVDVDGDGQLDGLFGSRSKHLIRLNMTDLTLSDKRSGWVQCGCHTTAMDVDRDGRWDFFAGSGDDSSGKGVLHRYDPVTLKSIWSYKTNDNASSADPVLADIDNDGEVEIIKSVDNYAGDDAHDAIYAFETDGTLLWKTDGFSGEDSPAVGDLDGDGEVEIVGMTFGCEVYCLDSEGRIKWRKDLRPKLSDADAHAYLTPILCDIDGDRELEIVAMTNGGYFDASGKAAKGSRPASGVVFALSADGKILDRFDVGDSRYWGTGFVSNIDDDPYLEIVVSGSGGLDVIETKGFGPGSEHFQRRRTYQRRNVVPWAYEDSYFIHRGKKTDVMNLTDNLVLTREGGHYRTSGTFTTELLTLPPGGFFDRITYDVRTPRGTDIQVNILSESGKPIAADVKQESTLNIRETVRLEFVFTTEVPTKTPTLDSYSLRFDRTESQKSLDLSVPNDDKD